MSWTAQKINNLFNPHRPLWLGVLGAVLGDTGREGGREGGGMRTVGGRELEVRKVGDEGGRKGGEREEGERQEGGLRSE